jgi:hypothetical protein
MLPLTNISTNMQAKQTYIRIARQQMSVRLIDSLHMSVRLTVSRHISVKLLLSMSA